MSAYPHHSRGRILLLEDEAIQAMSLQDNLEDAGFAVAGPFSVCRDALAWLEHEIPDLAVLDTIVKDGSCKGLAAELTRRGVPFIIYSGLQQHECSAPEFKNAVWVEKPAPFTALLEACADAERMRRFSVRGAPGRQANCDESDQPPEGPSTP